MTSTPTKIPRRCSPERPAPEALRCPTPGCFRRRNPSGSCASGLTRLCSHCHAVEAGRAFRPSLVPPGVAAGKALVLTRAVPADVYTVAACREPSKVPPEFRLVPAGTRVVAVGRLSKSDGGGDPVVQLECGGRFVCPPHAMRMVGVPS